MNEEKAADLTPKPKPKTNLRGQRATMGKKERVGIDHFRTQATGGAK